ncbi:DUF4296 domain-containing protein [uncultured Eudoraea sp.]|uniref:DUF4296 domain-containing protein n=1 Tax=uncultured Eudoraea sp. TaxID=1035614 RepID=UPI0026328006|nr:DUF4296 domain-containing protein [uncultured Eudoraea sp.]
MMRKIFLIIQFIVFISCGEEVIEKPVNLISKEKMIDVLYDMAIINSAKATKPQELENRNFVPMQFIYDKYDIDSIQFISSDLYYASLPLEYEDIYRKIENRIKIEKEYFEKVKEEKMNSLNQDKVVK